MSKLIKTGGVFGTFLSHLAEIREVEAVLTLAAPYHLRPRTPRATENLDYDSSDTSEILTSTVSQSYGFNASPAVNDASVMDESPANALALNLSYCVQFSLQCLNKCLVFKLFSLYDYFVGFINFQLFATWSRLLKCVK